MTLRIFIIPLVVALVLIAALGVPLVFGSHDAGCPLMPGQDVMCALGTLEYLRHWQVAFSAVLVALFVAALISHFSGSTYSLQRPRAFRLEYRRQRPRRPTLLQELYADGILNRKEGPMS
ncbi:MAG TPA: hypothetical protein VJB97_02845 [Candidatus Paceibacterota bacterium]